PWTGHSRAALPGPAVLAVTGSPDDGGRALLGEAAGLAAAIGGHVVAATPPADPVALAAWGADAALRFTGTEPRPVAAALAALVRGSAALPWAVLGGATPWDREVLARLAVHLDTGLLSDLTGVGTRPGREGRVLLAGGKPASNGSHADVSSTGQPQLATLRTGAFAPRVPRALLAPIPVAALDVPHDPHVWRWGREAEDDFDALERAGTVIGLGAGVDAGRYAEIEPLRAVLGAELAATRKVTDAGALAHCRQLGVTGRAVAPRLYLAIGISGSPHHLAGVDRAGTVVAVNSDPDAPVFAHCDVGLVADWQDVVPALTAAFHRTPRPAPAVAAAP
ncbi:electron transfer flavoprotein subunit alpha/FixB family protein, partial [Actinacidiphila rubida]